MSNQTKTSKGTVEAQFDEIRQNVPGAKNWQILRDIDNSYDLYDEMDNGDLRKIAHLGDTAPEALGTLNGVVLGMNIR